MGTKKKASSRRAFLRGTAAAITGTLATATTASEADPLITNVQDWASFTGDGVDETPYGLPIEFENDVIRRNVSWLTAGPISSINFTPIHALEGTITPQGCAFERHHSGAIELQKKDYRLMINGLVDTHLYLLMKTLKGFQEKIMSISVNALPILEWNGLERN